MGLTKNVFEFILLMSKDRDDRVEGAKEKIHNGMQSKRVKRS